MNQDTVILQLIVAFFTVHGMQFLKNAKWFPFLQAEWKTLCRIVGALAAVLTTVGVSMQLSGDTAMGGSIVIHYPPMHLLMHSFGAWILQQVYYNGVVQKKA